MNDQTGNGVGLVVRQVPVGRAVEIADRHAAIDDDVAGFGPPERVFLVDVELVGDLAHDFFEDILECDQTFERAVFVDDERKVGRAPQELPHLFVERCGFGHEVGLHRDAEDVEVTEGVFAFGRVGAPGIHGAHQILGVHHPDDVVRLPAKDRQAGMR